MLVPVSLGATLVDTCTAPGGRAGIILGTNTGHAATSDMPVSAGGASDDDDEHPTSTVTKYAAKSLWATIAECPFNEAE
jgi:hypothetical protein